MQSKNKYHKNQRDKLQNKHCEQSVNKKQKINIWKYISKSYQ